MNSISALQEDDPKIKIHALQRINSDVNEIWSQASLVLGTIEELFEDPTFSQRELAALVASKIYYHLAAYDYSLEFALNSKKEFDVSSKDDYITCIVGKCLDKYTVLRQEGSQPQPELQNLFDRVVESWTISKDLATLKDVVGVAVDARRLDSLEKVLAQPLSPEDGNTLLRYCLDMVRQYAGDREFRQSALKLLVGLFSSATDPINAMHCLIMLNDPLAVSEIVLKLVHEKDSSKDELAFNIGFELYANCPPAFLRAVLDKLLESEAKALESVVRLTHILSGKATSELHLQFLHSQNKADVAGLQTIKKTIESRSSVLSNGLVIANALMYCGTSVDTFLRENLEWLGKSTHWAKFTATASLGLIHRGHVKKSLDLLAPYLTSAAGISSPYQEGGALYALGLIHSPVCHDSLAVENAELAITADQSGQQQIIMHMLNAIRNAGQNDQLLHGACLGLGLTAMTLQDEMVNSQLKDLLNLDSAVVGEAAALAIGMVMLGSANGETIEMLMQYGQETEHEKITQGISMALAMVMYDRETEADTLIETLCCHKNAVFRCGGVFVTAMAYAGSANAGAIERLLNMAVTDVADEVRRYAIAYIGFLTFKRPKYCIDLVRLLADSYNPHTRYGVALAIGIACAGTGLKDAVELLENLCKDNVDYVRQIAYICLAMVLINQSKTNEKVESLRKTLEERIKDKHEELLTKLGCIVACGILDAGGRNVTIALHRNGHNLMKSIVGMAIFTQHWYWYSYLLLLSLTFHPTTDFCTSEEYKQPIHKWEIKAATLDSQGDEDQEPGPPDAFEWP